MVIYSTFLEKTNKSHWILRADLTDEKGMLTITLSIPAHLIEQHEHKIIQGRSISITNFRILPKTIYDCGDCDKIISLNESNIIDTMPEVCKQYCFIPDTTISSLQKKQKCTQLVQSVQLLHLPRELDCTTYCISKMEIMKMTVQQYVFAYHLFLIFNK